MVAHRIQADLAYGVQSILSTTDGETLKPGDLSGVIINITTAGAETRVLAEPVNEGQEVVLNAQDITTSATVTNAGAYNWDGTNGNIVLDTDGDFAVVKALNVAGTLKWALQSYRCTLS